MVYFIIIIIVSFIIVIITTISVIIIIVIIIIIIIIICSRSIRIIISDILGFGGAQLVFLCLFRQIPPSSRPRPPCSIKGFVFSITRFPFSAFPLVLRDFPLE